MYIRSMDSIDITTYFPVPAKMIYQTWLSSKSHAAMTGASAHIHEELHSEYTAWDGYIFGRIQSLEPDKRIVLSWRSTDFTDADQDSMLEIYLRNFESGCYLTINHHHLPDGEGQKYKDGWMEYYLKPMKIYFQNLL